MTQDGMAVQCLDYSPDKVATLPDRGRHQDLGLQLSLDTVDTEVKNGMPCDDSLLREAAHAPDPHGLHDDGVCRIDDNELIKQINSRVISVRDRTKAARLPFVISGVQRLDLLFFRALFSRLRKQEEKRTGIGDIDDIPTDNFQRVFERLFVLLGDEGGFDAREYDDNDNGYVGWGEFCVVYKKRQITIRLALCERIFLTFHNQESSWLAWLIGNGVLLTIMLSSLCFILSTVPECQDVQADGSRPKPKAVFETIEYVCLSIFCVEYLMRVITAWAVRLDIFDNDRLLRLATGYEQLYLPSGAMRTWNFMTSPANAVDLAAILPGIIGLFANVEGGGFVVLRLIRLTRIFRAFRNPKIKEPVIVIANTMKASTKALYVLAFNLLLALVISGSLIWLAEGGVWNGEEHIYERRVGQEWNHTTAQYDDVLGESPYLSIPHAFWWAIVTATTIGYGDMFPTTSIGYIIAATTMVFSLVILALPVGVIGGTFTQCWDDYLRNKEKEKKRERDDTGVMMDAMLRINPSAMGRILFIEVWNERFPKKDGDPRKPKPWEYQRPNPAEYMGQAMLDLDLCARKGSKTLEVETTRRETLKLKDDMDMVKRRVCGSIVVEYVWTPNALAKKTEEDSSLFADQEALPTCNDDIFPEYSGTLKVTVISATGLIDLNSKGSHGTSNSFCTVLCYPNSPPFIGEMLRPALWTSPLVMESLDPAWNASHEFVFNWSPPGPEQEEVVKEEVQVLSQPAAAEADHAKLDAVLELVRMLAKDLGECRTAVQELTARVDQVQGGSLT